jgi:hypothetical protein
MGRFDALLQPSKPTPKQIEPPVEIPRIPENLKAGKPEYLKPSLPESPKTGKPESSISRKPEYLKTRMPESSKAEKYSTQLDTSLIKRVKQYAIENDIKDYEVVQFALEDYLSRKK